MIKVNFHNIQLIFCVVLIAWMEMNIFWVFLKYYMM